MKKMKISISTNSAQIQFNERSISSDKILDIIEGQGYIAEIEGLR